MEKKVFKFKIEYLEKTSFISIDENLKIEKSSTIKNNLSNISMKVFNSIKVSYYDENKKLPSKVLNLLLQYLELIQAILECDYLKIAKIIENLYSPENMQLLKSELKEKSLTTLATLYIYDFEDKNKLKNIKYKSLIKLSEKYLDKNFLYSYNRQFIIEEKKYLENYFLKIVENSIKNDKKIVLSIVGLNYNIGFEKLKKLDIKKVKIKLMLEPNNPFDNNAIALYFTNKENGTTNIEYKIGYLKSQIAKLILPIIKTNPVKKKRIFYKDEDSLKIELCF